MPYVGSPKPKPKPKPKAKPADEGQGLFFDPFNPTPPSPLWRATLVIDLPDGPLEVRAKPGSWKRYESQAKAVECVPDLSSPLLASLLSGRLLDHHR